MNVLPPIFPLLKGSPDVRNIVATRIYRHGSAPQPGEQNYVAGPYITWAVVSDTPENHLQGTPPTSRCTIQVDCWHDKDAGVDTLCTAVRDALEPYCHMTGLVVDLREPDTKLYRMSLQFDFWNDRFVFQP